ncbi:unnamed protein product [Prorocentrum cordatum]|uniref:Cyclic nucleotide-binding domain-containing protein n=1 Tax=Prorocentrum cordatum TaxID=2364126 RepID=A0ABN9T246_9DINO|nr:unnamed protein product [Polarella glacialis]
MGRQEPAHRARALLHSEASEREQELTAVLPCRVPQSPDNPARSPRHPTFVECETVISEMVDSSDAPRKAKSAQPGEFEMLSVWNRPEKPVTSLKRLQTRMQVGPGGEDEPEPDSQLLKRCSRLRAVHPESATRLCWDCVALVLVVYECVMIPLLLLETPVFSGLGTMIWATRVFWSVDLPFSAVTGYLTGEGATELRATKALRHYVCTWFPLDFGLVLMDWGELIFGDATGANAARMGKTIKTVRMLRMMRLCRLARMKTLPEMVRTFIERFQSELAHIIAGLVKMIVMIIWFHHVTACVWLYLAMSRSERSDRNWLDKYGLSREGFYYQYCTSFHWSLTQFAGSMEVTPTNSTERLFAVCSLLVAFTVAAWVVSTLTTSMTRLEIAAGEEGKKLTDLTDWLIDNQISSALMARVRRNFRFAMLEERRGRPNVEMLRMLSKPLQAELSFEVHMKTLGVHPFLRTYAVSFESVAQQVCFRAVGLLQAVEGDQLFLEGQAPLEPKVYFVTSGALAYAQHRRRRARHDRGGALRGVGQRARAVDAVGPPGAPRRQGRQRGAAAGLPGVPGHRLLGGRPRDGPGLRQGVRAPAQPRPPHRPPGPRHGPRVHGPRRDTGEAAGQHGPSEAEHNGQERPAGDGVACQEPQPVLTGVARDCYSFPPPSPPSKAGVIHDHRLVGAAWGSEVAQHWSREGNYVGSHGSLVATFGLSVLLFFAGLVLFSAL